MSLIIQPAIPGAAPTPAGTRPASAVAARDATGGAGLGARAVAGAGAGAGTTAGATANTVAFSPVAVLLAQLQPGAAGTATLPAPDSDQAAAMTALLAQRLGVLLRDARLPAGPALAFEVGDDQILVASRRPDAATVQALVDAHPDVQVLVRLLHAINAGPLAALAAATLAATERRGAADDGGGAATAPASPQFNAWGWWGATPRRRATPAGQWVRLAWLAAAVLALLGWLLWRG